MAAAEPKVRPSKPDEEAFRMNLATAEKEHSAAQEKLVFTPITYKTTHRTNNAN